MFISTAWAQDGVAPESFFFGGGLMPLVLFFFIIYFFLIRPQNKRIRAQEELVKNLKRGDRIVTTAGIYGKITKVDDNIIKLEVADNTVITLGRYAVQTLMEKGSTAEPTQLKKNKINKTNNKKKKAA